MKVKNIDDLMSEIARLSLVQKEQEAYLGNQYGLLKAKLEKPVRVAKSLFSSIPGVGLVKDLVSLTKSKDGSVNSKSDWLTKTLQFGVPLVLNRTVLKNAGWVKKGLVLLASETAAGQVNQNKVGNLFSKLTDFIRPKKKKAKKKLINGIDEVEDKVHKGLNKVDDGIQKSHDKISHGLDNLKDKID